MSEEWTSPGAASVNPEPPREQRLAMEEAERNARRAEQDQEIEPLAVPGWRLNAPEAKRQFWIENGFIPPDSE
jgi:hypothetical protein